MFTDSFGFEIISPVGTTIVSLIAGDGFCPGIFPPFHVLFAHFISEQKPYLSVQLISVDSSISCPVTALYVPLRIDIMMKS
jgi:hypothetical protein